MDCSYSSYQSQSYHYGQNQNGDRPGGSNSPESTNPDEGHFSERVQQTPESSEPDNSWLDSWESPSGETEEVSGTTPSNGSGTFQLGNTAINIEGGTQEQRAKMEDSITAMYNSDPAFKNVIDSKAGSGININFKEYTDNTAGMAEIGGSNMTMDNTFVNEGDSVSIAEVVAHEIGHLAGMDHGSQLDNFAKTAGQSIA